MSWPDPKLPPLNLWSLGAYKYYISEELKELLLFDKQP
jgi:hypothetical protein